GDVTQVETIAIDSVDAQQPAAGVEAQATPIGPAPLPATAAQRDDDAVDRSRCDEAPERPAFEANAPAIRLENLQARPRAAPESRPGIEAVTPARPEAAVIGAGDEVPAEDERQARLQRENASEVAAGIGRPRGVGQRDVDPALVLG